MWANMDVAVASLGFPDTNCFGHTLQLAIKAALSHAEIQAYITAGRNIVTHYNHSPKTAGELRNQTASDKQKALQQDVETHWNSTYYMLNSLLPYREGIDSVLHNKDFTKPETARKLEIKNEHCVQKVYISADRDNCSSPKGRGQSMDTQHSCGAWF